MSETWKAITVIALTAAVIFVAGAVFAWVFPPRPQTITVHFDGPLKVEIQNR